MGKNYFNFKNLTTSLLIISFIVMPFANIPKKAEAQSIGAYVGGIVPAITQLPLCSGKLTGATKSLFKGNFSAAWGALTEKLGNKVAKKIEKELGDETSEKLSQVGSISTYDEQANKKLDKLSEKTDIIQESTSSLDANDTCLKNIGRLVIKMLLQKLTVSTVNWINSGFDGKPAFIQDSSKFFGDIAKNEFLQFGAEINNPELFPFGRIWLQNQAQHFNNRFTDNAQYSLDELIKNTTPQYSDTGFWLDFNQGGWGAWDAMTRYQGNNALGFQLMASNELQARLAGVEQSTAQNVRDALQAADGFLGDQRCAEPVGVTREEHNRALAGMGKGPAPTRDDFFIAYDAGVGPNGETGEVDEGAYQAALASWNATPENRTCSRWEYVTPGKLIAEAATSTIHYPENNLLKADDLNDAVAAIMDALLSKFSNDLMQKGYANLGDDDFDGNFAYADNSFSGSTSTQTETDFRPVHLANSWLAENPNFNIRTDLNQALIDEQRTYVDKLKQQNIELNSTIDGNNYKIDARSVELADRTNAKISNAYGLIPVINQLDYCIPGPHPGWEEDSQQVLNAITNAIIPETMDSIGPKSNAEIQVAAQSITPAASAAVGALIGAKLGATAGTAIFPVVGTVIGAAVGVVISTAIGWLWGGNSDTEKYLKLRNYYASILGSLTGIEIDPDPAEDTQGFKDRNVLSSKQGVTQALNVILKRYIDIMHKVYNEKVLPELYRDAAIEFNKIPGYTQIIENNKNEISVLNSVISTLEEIKVSVDNLNNQLEETEISNDEYENQLQAQINAFGRISANMVSGDDIASADNLLKQIISEASYIYNHMLKGPFGCEKELEDKTEEANRLPEQLYMTTRPNYPAPILYTYDMLPGKEIPDPWDSGFQNKTNTKATHVLGPGFLSYYYYQTTDIAEALPCVVNETNGVVPWCELEIKKVVPFKPANFQDRKRNVPVDLRRSLGLIPLTEGETETENGQGRIIPGLGGGGDHDFRIYGFQSSPFENTIFVY